MPSNSLYIKPGTPPSTNIPVKIESLIGGDTYVYPSTETSILTGFTSDEVELTISDFVATVSIGGVPLPQQDPGTPDVWFEIIGNTIKLNNGTFEDGDLVTIIIYR